MKSKAPVKFGFTVQERHFAQGVDALHALTDELERQGLDFASVLDHLSFWDGTGFDAIVNATALATASPHLPILISVMVLPVRNPVTVARHVSSMSVLAPGRLLLGVGVGGEDPHEIAAAGVDPRTRGRLMDESLEILERLMAGERVTWHGDFFTLDDVCIRPQPASPVPILIGGRSDVALRRTARLGQGWLGFACSPERFSQAVKIVDVEAERVGRTGIHFDHGLVAWCGFGTGREARDRLGAEIESLYKLPFERFARYCPCGTPEEVAEQLAEYVPAGCRRFSIIPVGSDPAHEIEAVAAIRAELARPER